MVDTSSSICRLSCWVRGRLRSSFAPALPPSLTQVLPLTQILLLVALPLILNYPSKEDPDANEKPNATYTSQQVDGGHLVLVGIGVR